MNDLSEYQYDALRETANIAIDVFVSLSIPEIVMLAPGEILGRLKPDLDAEGKDTDSIVRMGFQGLASGEALVLFWEKSLESIANILGSGRYGVGAERELLLDIANILAGTCLGELGKRLTGDLSVARPSIYCHNLSTPQVFATLFGEEKTGWDNSLVIRIKFELESQEFDCDLLIFMTDKSIQVLKEKLDLLIGEI
jgi:chemotaxis protein CheY-P-specific phosphatase CheC